MTTTQAKEADNRLKKTGQEREMSDEDRTLKTGLGMTVEELRSQMRSDWNQEILPTPPKSEEWHYCWLSTTNSADPIHQRMRRGYVPVMGSEIPGFSQYRVEQGEYEGQIACNEMLLFKLRRELYEEVMKILHEDRPNEEEALLRANAPVKAQDRSGRKLGYSEGY